MTEYKVPTLRSAKNATEAKKEASNSPGEPILYPAGQDVRVAVCDMDIDGGSVAITGGLETMAFFVSEWICFGYRNRYGA